MKNYTLKAVSVTLDGNTFMDKLSANIVPSIASEKNVTVIPTIAYEILKEQIKNNNDNYIYIKAFLDIIKTLYIYDNKELNSDKLKSITKDYKSYLESIRPIILKSDYPTYNSTEQIKNRSTIHSLRAYSDLTFISLTEEIDYNVVSLDFDYKGLSNTPLDNDIFINTLMKSKLDARSAIYAEYQYINSDNFITTNDKKDKYNVFIKRVNVILNFLTVRKANKANKVDRVYSSFTSLSKISRKYLTMNNKPFIEIDIKNCQPLLLTIVLNENKLTIDKDYVNDVTNGKFYEMLMKEAKTLGYTEEKIFVKNVTTCGGIQIPITKTLNFNDREQVKVMCYNDIFFANKHKETKLVKIFKSLYPNTYQSLLEVTKNTTLAHLLQNLEADLVLNIIPNSPYFTVHDAIYLTRTTEIMKVMKQLELSIYNRSGGLIKEVKFAELKDNKIIIIDDIIDNQIEILNIKERASHSVKQIKINNFIKMMEQGMEQEDIMNILKITSRTFYRYKKQLLETI